MKRFRLVSNVLGGMEECEDGDYVLFDEAYAEIDKAYFQGVEMQKRLLRLQLGLAVESD